MKKLAFIVNPISGLGGPLALKGSDNIKLMFKLLFSEIGPENSRAQKRAKQFISNLTEKDKVEFLTASNLMGEATLKDFNLKYRIIHQVNDITGPEDTRAATSKAICEGAELVVFVGGDGTARDVATVSGYVPILGVPAGVKIFSGVFAATPRAAAEIVDAWIRGEAEIVEEEVLDVDEEAYRKNNLAIRLYSVAKTVKYKQLLQSSKGVFHGPQEEEEKKAIAEYVAEEKIEPNTLYILGPGSTVAALAKALGVEKTLLGVDLFVNGEVVVKDAAERDILPYIEKYDRVKLVLSPVGRQGFILGRGNLQISPKVLRKISKEDLIVVATKRKLRETPLLRVDTGDEELDKKFAGYIRVITGYREERIVRVE